MNNLGKRDFLFPWYFEISQEIQNAIHSCWPRYWQENDITTSILRAICKTNHQVLYRHVPPFPVFTVEWDSFKLNGKLETDCGDVAILVRLHSTNKPILEGVGYFESKRIYENGRFDGIKSWDQFELMQLKVPHHHVVLYDYKPCNWTLLRSTRFGWELAQNSRVTCLTLPTNRLLALRSNTRELYCHSISFVEQLCFRYIQGFDLEYDKCLVESAKGFINKKGGPGFLLVANVVIGDGERPIVQKSLQNVEISSDYIRISSEMEDRQEDKL